MDAPLTYDKDQIKQSIENSLMRDFGVGVHDATDDQLSGHRRRIADLVSRADPALLPPGFETWADEA